MAYSQIGDRVEGPSRCLTGAESFLDCVRLCFSLTLESTTLLYVVQRAIRSGRGRCCSSRAVGKKSLHSGFSVSSRGVASQLKQGEHCI
jgi:hypothetical protein